MKIKSVSILIPTHNRRDLLARTLESLRQMVRPEGFDIELIVVANACSDDTEAMVTEAALQMPFPTRCVNEPEMGVCHARNRCLALASGDLMAFLDDDVWVDTQWLSALVEVYQSPDIDIVGGRVKLWWEAVREPPDLAPSTRTILSQNDWGNQLIPLDRAGLVGANFSFRRIVGARVPGFRADLDRKGSGLLGGGENDFVDRAVAAGFRAVYAPQPVVKHWVAAHRLESKYLDAVSYGTGQAFVFMKPCFGPLQFARTVVGHLYLVVWNTIAFLFATLCNKRGMATHHRTRLMMGLGGLTATWARLARTRSQQPDPSSPRPL